MKILKPIDQAGAVSMLSVVIFSIILTIVSTSYIRTVISQQKNAFDYDLGNRAYYAAESGVQDGIRALRADPARYNTKKTDCTPYDGMGNLGAKVGADIEYTCQLISPQAKSIPVSISKDQNTLVRLDVDSPEAIDYNLAIRWSQKTKPGDEPAVPRQDNSRYFSSEANWSNGTASYHPALRASVISFEKDSSNATMLQNVFFLNPTDSTLSPANGTSTITEPVSTATVQDKLSMVQNADCVASDGPTGYGLSGDYSCEQIVQLKNYRFSSDAVYLRLRSLYAPTKVEIVLQKGVTPVALKNTVAEIDVTGRSGNVFRRVKQSVPLNNGITTDSLPEAAVYAGDGICKLYRIGSVASQFIDDCATYNAP